MKHNKNYLIKIFLIFLALIFATILLLSEKAHQKLSNQTTHFIVDTSNSMNTKDVTKDSKTQSHTISRLQAIKEFIIQTIKDEPLETYSLVIFWDSIDFYIPPTQDTGTFLEYLNQINTNLLPWWWTNINLIGDISLNFKSIDKIIIFSDFDYESNPKLEKEFLKLKKSNTYLVWVGSKSWWEVRYSDDSVLKKDLVSVISKRGDKVAKYISKKINSKYYTLDNTSKIAKLSQEITNSNRISFSESQTQIIIWILGLLVLIWI